MTVPEDQSPRPRVFISFTRKDSDGLSAARGLKRWLEEEEGFEAFVDQSEIPPGATWRSELYTQISECHAALIVLSPKATESEWVRIEATLLLHRYHYLSPRSADPIEGGFVLVPVLANTQWGDLRHGAPLDPTFEELGHLQAVTHEDRAALRRALAPVLERVGYIDVELQAERWLAEVLTQATRVALEKVHTTCAERCARSSTRRALGFRPDEHALRARQVASAVLDLPPLDAVNALRPMLREIPDPARVLKILLQNWVDAEAASRLRAVITGTPSTALLSTTNDDTARWHARRAERWYAPEWHFVSLHNVSAGEDQLRTVRAQLTGGLVEALGCESEDELSERLTAVQDEIILVFYPGFIEADDLVELMREFDPAVFLIGTGDLDPASAQERLRGAIYVEPPVDPEKESKGLQNVRWAKSSFYRTLPEESR